MEAPLPPSPGSNRVLLYLMMTKAARDFGLTDSEIAAVAVRFERLRPRCTELAHALADLIIARSGIAESANVASGQDAADGAMF
jgi:hypothetical protein